MFFFQIINQVNLDYLKNKSRSFVFSTSLKSFEIIENDKKLIKQSNKNIEYICKSLKSIGINVNRETPIIPIPIGDEKKAVKIN